MRSKGGEGAIGERVLTKKGGPISDRGMMVEKERATVVGEGASLERIGTIAERRGALVSQEEDVKH